MTTTLVSEQMPPNGWGGSCKTKNWHGSEIHVWWKNWTGRTANNVEEVLARQWGTSVCRTAFAWLRVTWWPHSAVTEICTSMKEGSSISC
jgi:hypothetical protein